MIYPTFGLGPSSTFKKEGYTMERKTYGYQFQMVQLIVRKTQKVETAKEEKQPLNEPKNDRGSFMIQRNPP